MRATMIFALSSALHGLAQPPSCRQVSRWWRSVDVVQTRQQCQRPLAVTSIIYWAYDHPTNGVEKRLPSSV